VIHRWTAQELQTQTSETTLVQCHRRGWGRVNDLLTVRRVACLWNAALFVLFSALASMAQEDSGAEPFAFSVSEINAGLSASEPLLRLDTPRAALESFLDAVNENDQLRAAQALNLAGIPEQDRAVIAPRLAMMLAYLLLRYDMIDWSEVPDEPDARVLPDVQGTSSPYSRRAIPLGELDLDGRPVPISIQRFKVEGEAPVWLFSPFAVERVGRLYAASQPGLLSDWIPLHDRINRLGQPSLREWLIVAMTLMACLILGLVIHGLMKILSRRVRPSVAKVLRIAALPLALTIAALTFRFGIGHLILLTGPVASSLDIWSELLALIAGAWLLNRTLATVTLSLSERYVVPLPTEDHANRRIKTNVYVLRRIAVVLTAVLSVGYILLRAGIFETFGISILVSAGALGVVVAIAAQPLLGNMVAGMQIALSDPIRIGDVVMYEEHWATVEDITFAYVVLRTDRNTRLIVPHSEFLSRAVENWSKEGDTVRRIVKLPVDYRIDVDLIRREVHEIVNGDPRLIDAPTVEMVEVTEDAATLWIWITASTSATSWTLHNEVREKLLRFLIDLDDGAYLPKKRHLIDLKNEAAG
jgi:small-conductance mechanosensitive channel